MVWGNRNTPGTPVVTTGICQDAYTTSPLTEVRNGVNGANITNYNMFIELQEALQGTNTVHTTSVVSLPTSHTKIRIK